MKYLEKIGFIAALMLAIACQPEAEVAEINLPKPDSDNAGLTLPENFGALVVADSLGRGRHLAVNNNGDIYVHLRRLTEDSVAIIALRDSDGDGRADMQDGFSRTTGTGLRIHNNHLYYSDPKTVYRSALIEGQLLPDTKIDTLVHLEGEKGHTAKSFTFDGKGNMYVNNGSMSNACQEESRTKGSPGIDPCIELETRAGIWKFSDSELHQQQTLDKRYATGMRNTMALSWSESDQMIYAASHGRDDLHRFWPDLFTASENVELPAEEVLGIMEGDDFGWPYCYYNHFTNQKLLNPEYGGDGKMIERCADKKNPIVGLPGHWAPNDLLVYTGNQFPAKYKEGVFIAFHGSWNRLEHDQAGFKVVFLPLKNGKATGDYEIFADGFVGDKPVQNPGKAVYRPCGLAQGPDGSIYIVDSQQGRVWRISYYEEGWTPIAKQQAPSPDSEAQTDESTSEVPKELAAGKQAYELYCAACHNYDGTGVPGMNPPLVNTDWVTGDEERLINVILNGMNEPIVINGETYQNAMASHRHLNDQQISDILSYIRNSWGNEAAKISMEEVAKIRAKN